MRFRLTISSGRGFYTNSSTALLVEGIDYRVTGENLVLLQHGTRCFPGKSRAARRVRRLLREGRIPVCESNESYRRLAGGPCPLLAYNPLLVPEVYEVTLLILSALLWARITRNPEVLKKHLRAYITGSCGLVASHWWRILREQGITISSAKLVNYRIEDAGAAPIVKVSGMGVSTRRLRCHIGSTRFTATYVIDANIDVGAVREALQLFSRSQVSAAARLYAEMGVSLLRPVAEGVMVKIGPLAWPINSLVVLARYEGMITGSLFESLMDVRRRCGFDGWPPSGLYAALIEPLGLIDPGWVRVEVVEEIS